MEPLFITCYRFLSEIFASSIDRFIYGAAETTPSDVFKNMKHRIITSEFECDELSVNEFSLSIKLKENTGGYIIKYSYTDGNFISSVQPKTKLPEKPEEYCSIRGFIAEYDRVKNSVLYLLSIKSTMSDDEFRDKLVNSNFVDPLGVWALCTSPDDVPKHGILIQFNKVYPSLGKYMLYQAPEYFAYGLMDSYEKRMHRNTVDVNKVYVNLPDVFAFELSWHMRMIMREITLQVGIENVIRIDTDTILVDLKVGIHRIKQIVNSIVGHQLTFDTRIALLKTHTPWKLNKDSLEVLLLGRKDVNAILEERCRLIRDQVKTTKKWSFVQTEDVDVYKLYYDEDIDPVQLNAIRYMIEEHV